MKKREQKRQIKQARRISAVLAGFVEERKRQEALRVRGAWVRMLQREVMRPAVLRLFIGVGPEFPLVEEEANG